MANLHLNVIFNFYLNVKLYLSFTFIFPPLFMYFNIDFNNQLIVTVGFQVKTHTSFISSFTEIFGQLKMILYNFQTFYQQEHKNY